MRGARGACAPRCRSCSRSTAPSCAARSTCSPSAGRAPLVVDYKTDRLAGTSPPSTPRDYEIQRSIYALAVAESREAEEVEVAYVFLERPDDPQVERLGPAELEAARARLADVVDRIGAGEYPVAPVERRSEQLCRGCPARGRVCSGPRRPA